MKKRTSSAVLTLLLLLSLTGCGGEQGGFVPEASNDQVWAVVPDGSGVVSLPVQDPEDGSQPWDGSRDTSDADQNTPDAGQSAPEGNGADSSAGKTGEGNRELDEDGWYSSKEEVALYIHLYGELPGNYVTKDEAEQAGWHGGNVERYTGEGTAIGGSRFGNREGLLPKERGRTYTECDIGTVGESSRGAERIVFSNDGLVYYTDDHYESFQLLYGEP